MDPQHGDTGYTLAVRARLDHWPAPCPLCGKHGPMGRYLTSTPGRKGQARYFCCGCRTTFARRLHQVARYARRAP